ncbi:trk system potassium uptake protein TrkH [Xylanibacter ruminicola]|jgi:trk system potassium uptake protein TrkH|uniref:Trk system potassium uptake protein TrkH n=1 Tax=Xylanibacter ruminicola TaxID=839 RepID=A0A1H5UXS6_XYLRU|nr:MULTISPECIES: TrkH family potassium uptake protein [Prevotellaceae]MCR5471164.1 TrkH family potassium uptake protein [Prevotella sp.]SEF79895.1 trk system potassium uptake protein TrkH [Xylanibacter ruminicola]SEW26150.1 trk system potassium uptake protein TrkH [Prevotella sp. khp7]
MVNFRIISKIIGSLLFIEAFFMSSCALMAFSYHEDDLMAFLMSLLLTFGSGFFFLYLGRNSENSLSRRDAYVVVTAAWVVFSFFGMFPFLIHGSITNVTDAYFETMSGFSTTGATILDDVECLPHAILFWRSLMQWIGGLGIVFFTIAILPSLVGGSVKVFAAEATGPIKAKMHPRLSTTAKWIWSIYLILTFACGLSFWTAGMNWFEALNYSMTTTATGGFSIHNESTEFFHSPTIDYISITFQFLSGINFTLLYITIFKMKLKSLFTNSEFRLYISIMAGATLWIMYLLISRMDYDFEHAFRSALFQVVSFMTTTGMFNEDAGTWPHVTWVILGVVMYLGACAGSTSGGFKCIRGVMLLKVVRNNFRQSLHPNAVLPVKVNGQNIPQSKLITLFAFFTLTMLMILVTATIMIVAGIDNTNAITIALSCVSNVGPTLGTQIGPVMSWSILPEYIKWILCLLMLMGRLEIMTVLVLFTRSFWKEN